MLAAEEGHELEHDVDGVLRGDAEERGGLVAEVRPTTGQVGERADDDERDAELVRHERDGGALHLDGGAPELGADELAVGGVIDEHVGAASPGDAHHPRSARQTGGRVHARRQLHPLELLGEVEVARAGRDPERVLPLLRLVPDAVERVPILATTDDVRCSRRS
jgi:hypothetical protein